MPSYFQIGAIQVNLLFPPYPMMWGIPDSAKLHHKDHQLLHNRHMEGRCEIMAWCGIEKGWYFMIVDKKGYQQEVFLQWICKNY